MDKLHGLQSSNLRDKSPDPLRRVLTRHTPSNKIAEGSKAALPPLKRYSVGAWRRKTGSINNMLGDLPFYLVATSISDLEEAMIDCTRQ